MTELLVYKNGAKEFKIQIGDKGNPVTYQVVGKYDADAPDGFQRARTTKVLDPDISNSVCFGAYDSDRGVYDTGLTKYSKSLSKVYPNEDDRQRALSQITKLILNPLIDLKGADKIDPSNNEFWDDFRTNISLDQSFNTSDPLQLYQLYILILRGVLAPVGLESEAFFKRDAQYAVENKDSVVDVSQKRELEKNKSVARFMNLLDSDPTGLEAILEWMGVPGVAGAEDALLNTIFTQWLQKDDNQNPKQFLETYANYYESTSGKQILTIFKELRRLEKLKFVKRTTAGIMLNDTFLGENMKKSAEAVAKDTDLLQKVYDLADSQ